MKAFRMTSIIVVTKLENPVPRDRRREQPEDVAMELRIKKQIAMGRLNDRRGLGELSNIKIDFNPRERHLRRHRSTVMSVSSPHHHYGIPFTFLLCVSAYPNERGNTYQFQHSSRNVSVVSQSVKYRGEIPRETVCCERRVATQPLTPLSRSSR